MRGDAAASAPKSNSDPIRVRDAQHRNEKLRSSNFNNLTAMPSRRFPLVPGVGVTFRVTRFALSTGFEESEREIDNRLRPIRFLR